MIAFSSNVWQGFSEDADGNVWISDFNEGFRFPERRPRPSIGSRSRAWGVELLHDRARKLLGRNSRAGTVANS